MRREWLAGGMIGLILIIAGGVVWWRETEQGAGSSSTQLQVVASFSLPAHFVEQVAGNRAHVSALIPAGASPHFYEFTPQDIARVYQGDVFFYTGLGFDGAAEEIAVEAVGHGVHSARLTDGLALRTAAVHGEEEDHEEEEESEEHGEFDPHVWLDPLRARTMVMNIATVFAEADPEYAAQYLANAEAYGLELVALDQRIQAELSNCRLREAIVSHDAFGYFGERYGISFLPIAGISPDQEPSPQTMGALARLAQEHGIRHIFFERLVSPRLAETIATEVGATTALFDPIEGISDPQVGYIALMEENVLNLSQALQCQ